MLYRFPVGWGKMNLRSSLLCENGSSTLSGRWPKLKKLCKVNKLIVRKIVWEQHENYTELLRIKTCNIMQHSADTLVPWPCQQSWPRYLGRDAAKEALGENFERMILVGSVPSSAHTTLWFELMWVDLSCECARMYVIYIYIYYTCVCARASCTFMQLQ